MSVGMVLAFMMYHQYFIRSLKGAADALLEWGLLRIHLDRLNDIVATDPEPSGSMALAITHGRIIFEDVSFSYSKDSNEKIVEKQSFAIEPGKFLAITGRSGAGKTTLLKLLLGLEKPTSGRVTIDGIDVCDATWSAKAEAIAVVMQDDSLLAGTITENIAFFNSHPDVERTRWAAKMACIDKDVSQMPMGFDTVIGDLGNTLSGGQKARIMIARALYRLPRILILDEGTAYLDLATETELNSNLKKMEITRIAFAHRPDTLAIADEVLLLSNGKLVPWKKSKANCELLPVSLTPT
jgi:ATP-binding cassette, subfamily B, bacterial CvaB/MchF/RaxB